MTDHRGRALPRHHRPAGIDTSWIERIGHDRGGARPRRMADRHAFTNDRRQCPAATIARVMESAMPWWSATRMPGFFGLRFTAWKSRKPTDTCATAR